MTNQWVTRGEMCVLEGFRLFKMCLYIFTLHFFSLNLVPLYTFVSKYNVSVNFSSEFNSRVISMSLPVLVYLCPIEKTSHPCCVSKQLV